MTSHGVPCVELITICGKLLDHERPVIIRKPGACDNRYRAPELRGAAANRASVIQTPHSGPIYALHVSSEQDKENGST
jgi:hypothetical protein